MFDVASPIGLVSHDNDFGITLAKWGAEQGPYMVLPLFGPQTVRDVWSVPVGFATDPITWVDPPLYVTIPLYTLEAVDVRSRYEKAFKLRNAAALDPYVFTRDAYLQHRQSQVTEGKVGGQKSVYDEEEEAGTQPASQPNATTQPAKP